MPVPSPLASHFVSDKVPRREKSSSTYNLEIPCTILTIHSQCAPVYDAVTQVLNKCNLIGVATRINDMKGLLFRLSSNGIFSGIDWNNYFRFEVEILQQYLTMTYDQFQNIVVRLGAIMDNLWHDEQERGLPGPSAPPSEAFTRFVTDRWNAILRRVQDALNVQLFKIPADLDQYYGKTPRWEGLSC